MMLFTTVVTLIIVSAINKPIIILISILCMFN